MVEQERIDRRPALLGFESGIVSRDTHGDHECLSKILVTTFVGFLVASGAGNSAFGSDIEAINDLP